MNNNSFADEDFHKSSSATFMVSKPKETKTLSLQTLASDAFKTFIAQRALENLERVLFDPSNEPQDAASLEHYFFKYRSVPQWSREFTWSVAKNVYCDLMSRDSN
jgi:hypothetical protein